jgi:hypothetical protein
MIPVIDVLAQNDQLRARDGLGCIDFIQENICRRTAGAALGSEQLN